MSAAAPTETTGRRGRKDDPLYKYRRTLLTRTNYLTERQKQRLDMLWATDEDYVALEVAWLFYQDLIQAYGHPKMSEVKKLMMWVFNSIRRGLPTDLEELAQLGRTLWRQREDVPAYFDMRASNGCVSSGYYCQKSADFPAISADKPAI